MPIETAAQSKTRVSTCLQEVVDTALRWIQELSRGPITAQVRGRHVTLIGQVDWAYQREAAEQTVRNVPGVESWENQITTVERTPLQNAEEPLRNAMFRDPQIDAEHVTVTVHGRRAVLTGQVKTLAEKRQAGLAAWISPGVVAIDNRLDVRPL